MNTFLRGRQQLTSILVALALLLAGPGSFDGHLPHDHSGIEHLLTDWRGTALADNHQYTCSMHPFILRDEPGNCPICGMTLVPVKSSSGSSQTSITIDPVTQQNMGIRTAKAAPRDLERTIRTVGIVGYEEPHQYSINTKIDGWVERLHVNETGGFVKKGQPLLEIYSPELVAAQEEFLLALRNRDALRQSILPEVAAGAERLLNSSRKRLRYWDISDQQIRALEESGTVSKNLVIHAPYDGIVTAKKVTQGMFAKAGMELYQLADISRVWVYADIYEYELPWVKEGQQARIELPYRTAPITGTISRIYPYVEAKTRTVKARIALHNPDLELKPDMYVTVRLNASSAKGVLAIPAEAVLFSGEKQTVFVALGGGKFEPRPVRLGLRGDGGFVQILDGLGAGELVVTSAQFMLDSESTLRGALQKMQQIEAAPAAPAKENLEELF